MNLSDIHFRPNSHDDQIVFKELVLYDMYQLKHLSKITRLYKDWVCIDGGGHIGLFSLLLSQYVDGVIYTYEPNPDSYKYCILNTKNTPGVNVIQKGLDVKNGSFKLFPPKNAANTGSWSMVPTHMHDRNNPVEIETVNLSDVLKEFSSSGNNILVKLDLEGYEAKLIQELPEETLKTIKILILEEHHLPIDHEKLDRLGFRLLFHPLKSNRHFVYFNISGESVLVQNLLDIKCHIGDLLWQEKVKSLKQNSRITLRRIISGIRNKIKILQQ